MLSIFPTLEEFPRGQRKETLIVMRSVSLTSPPPVHGSTAYIPPAATHEHPWAAVNFNKSAIAAHIVGEQEHIARPDPSCKGP
jgi:hypothetical protein